MSRDLRNKGILQTTRKQYQPINDITSKNIKSTQLHSPKLKPTLPSKSKSKSTHKNTTNNKLKPPKNDTIKSTPRDSSENISRVPLNRTKFSVSKDKQGGREKQFKRKNNKRIDDRCSRSKKDSKRSTDNENEETLIERLRAENQFYRKAYLTSKDNFDKLEKVLQEQKYRRSHQKEWFRSQIDILKRKLSVDKIKLCHIFTFQSFENQEISNMILQTENQSSSLMVHNDQALPLDDGTDENLSDLSIESK